jgi:hypothetical protein
MYVQNSGEHCEEQLVGSHIGTIDDITLPKHTQPISDFPGIISQERNCFDVF